MNKWCLTLLLLTAVFFSVGRVTAQTTEPGTNLPLLPDDTTSATTTYTQVPSYSTYQTQTTYSATTSQVSTTQSAVDDAETGSELIFLVILSITGGIGLFLIKKYFDFKRYSI